MERLEDGNANLADNGAGRYYGACSWLVTDAVAPTGYRARRCRAPLPLATAVLAELLVTPRTRAARRTRIQETITPHDRDEIRTVVYK